MIGQNTAGKVRLYRKGYRNNIKKKIFSMLISLLYEACLILLSLLAFPSFFYQWVFKGKYRKTILKRFGSGFPLIKKEGRPVIWIHAVSLGETKAVAPLVKLIKTAFHQPIIIFSTTTETGHIEALRVVPADHHVYLPFDFWWVINPIIKRCAPNMLILCESDFWYNLLKSAKKNGALVAVVNGKISTRSTGRFKKIPFFAKALFSKIDIFSLQSALYQKRFEEIGVPKEKITISGNMKFDGDYTTLSVEQVNIWKKELGIQETDQVIVVGSTHSQEEVWIVDLLSEVWKEHPHLKVLFVPRHPERFNEVAGIFQKKNIPFRRLSQKNNSESQPQVILIDAMGLLRKCYQLADIAIVCGSYTSKVGGHNILEPCWYGVPVFFGPYMYAQPDLVDQILEYEAGALVPLEDLQKELIKFLSDPDLRKKMGDKGLKLAADVHGATNKTLEILKLKTKPFF